MSKHELLNGYLSSLAVMNIKLHTLHWNVVGMEFMAIHNFTETLYNDFFVKYDDVAELLKIQGVKPFGSMKEYLEASRISESFESKYSPKDVVDILGKDLNVLKESADAIRSSADQDGDYEAVAMFEDHLSFIDKNLWFLRSMAA